MFIYVAYKDAPELSSLRVIRLSNETLVDNAVEKTLLVNPDCPVRIMLEYIRKKCRLGVFTHFDLCDESGVPMGLFNLQTYAYATDQFEHKKTYYIIVFKLEDRRYSMLPQLNRENKMYDELKAKVKMHFHLGDQSPQLTSGKSITTAPSITKMTPSLPVQTVKRK